MSLTNREKAKIYDLFALPQNLRHRMRDTLDVKDFADATAEFIEHRIAILGLDKKKETACER